MFMLGINERIQKQNANHLTALIEELICAFTNLTFVDRDQGMSVRSSSTALNFAKHGFGVALLPSAMASDDLLAGRLQQIEIPSHVIVGEYRIAYPKRLKSNAGIKRLLDSISALPQPSGRRVAPDNLANPTL